MRLLPYAAIFLLGGLSLASIATSQTRERNQPPTNQIAADLKISDAGLVKYFGDVR